MNDLIRLGDRSNRVADVQARLRGLSFTVEDETRVFGDSTRRAVREFQQRRNILVDGIVGPQTWQELVEASWQLGDRALYLKHPPMRGDDIESLQTRLSALGFDAGRADGILGVQTDIAIRAFQKEYGIAEDGIFGLLSLTALSGLRVDRAGTAASLREELSRAEKPGIGVALVVIDPGHGGPDSGRAGARGLLEADVCWDIAQRLAARLIYSGGRVRFTRTEAEECSATERARRGNEIGGDVFVSLHLNTHDEPTPEGASTFYFGGSRSGETLADKVLDELAALGLRDCRSHARSYTILKETRMPAVLVEPVFITNPDEEKRLEDLDFRATLAAAIARGIIRYFHEKD
ncbi:MAG: N-acetylmuramoyl-L-alanine amidase [Actinomycetota bacterium]